ncbi:MAG: DHH family phosphoesterase [Clostridia bacterium]|nr:DHH family phosphoesterase [Clostridia bacterium]
MKKKIDFKSIIIKSILPFIALLALVADIILVVKNPDKAIPLGIGGVAIFSAIMVIWVIFFISASPRTNEKMKPVLSNIMYNKINSLNEPALICDINHKIVWANPYTATAVGKRSVLGDNASNLLSYHIGEEKSQKSDEETRLVLGENTYIVEEEGINSGNERYYLLTLRNITEQARLEQFIVDEETIVSYVIIDNLDELLRFEQERYREIAAKVEAMLRGWCDSVGGLLKEYEKDKYIFIFNGINLDRFVEDKFSILDKVREIRVGSGSIPVTLSIGVSRVKGSMAEKEKTAHIALDMALQRGGDQAAVKIGDQITFYGGKTNTLQNRTKVRSRVIANELANRIASASNVLVMGHAFPDYDAIGSAVGIARLAMYCGVKVNIVTNFKDSNVKRCMKILEKDEHYKGVFVNASKGLDLVKPDTLLIVVDVNNPWMFESKDIAKQVDDIIFIDHHRKTGEFEREPVLTYIEPSASSASEIVTEILEHALPTDYLTPTDADMLYAGIILDTKHFVKGTGTKTHSAAMFLRDHGASYESIQDLFKTNIADYKKEAKLGEKAEIYRNCVAIVVNAAGADSSDKILAAKVADDLLTLEGVSASFALVKVGNAVHISARSNGTINVQLIVEKLGGGGRYDEAGAQVKDCEVAQVLLRLKQAIDEYINLEE